jgi:porphobilinogen deaminase
MKDLATVLPPGISFCGVMERNIVADAVVLHPKHLAAFEAFKASPEAAAFAAANPGASLALAMLPEGSVIGTSALRRRATLARYHPQLRCEEARGNVLTRLNKLDSGLYDALILARVGLTRLDLLNRISEELSAEHYLHAVGQGALATVCRTTDAPDADAAAVTFTGGAPPAPADPATATVGALVFAALHNSHSEASCVAERGMLAALQGGCKVPIAVYSSVTSLTRGQAQALVAAAEMAADDAAGGDAVTTVDLADKAFGGVCSAEFVQLPFTTMVFNEEDAVDVVVTRASVLSLNGKLASECSAVAVLDAADDSARTQGRRYAAAWEAGVQLGARLRRLGAETILKEIR